MITIEQIEAAELDMNQAREVYEAALQKYQDSSWWKSAGLKKKTEVAEAAFKDAEQRYLAIMNADAAEEYSENVTEQSADSMKMLIPIVIVVVIAITTYLIIKK